MSDEEIKRYLASIGGKGGKAGKGQSKVRGGSDYYKRIAKLSAKARKAHQSAKIKTPKRRTKRASKNRIIPRANRHSRNGLENLFTGGAAKFQLVSASTES
jgi:hypothetical protein